MESPAPALLARADARLSEKADRDMKSLANRLLVSRDSRIDLPVGPLLTKEDKANFNTLISTSPEGQARGELVQFYRLLIIMEALLYRYRRLYP